MNTRPVWESRCFSVNVGAGGQYCVIIDLSAMLYSGIGLGVFLVRSSVLKVEEGAVNERDLKQNRAERLYVV